MRKVFVTLTAVSIPRDCEAGAVLLVSDSISDEQIGTALCDGLAQMMADHVCWRDADGAEEYMEVEIDSAYGEISEDTDLPVDFEVLRDGTGNLIVRCCDSMEAEVKP